MDVYVQAVGVLGPGLDGWGQTRPILRGEEPYRLRPTSRPVPDLLPATERRRSSETVRLAVAAAQEALSKADVPVDDLATVFASSDGDGGITQKICESLAGPAREVSPTMFHNSVYNAPAGYWSIATGSRAGSTSLCAYDWSFAAGLVEAAIQVTVERRPVMLIALDVPFPHPLHAVRPVTHPFAAAMLLTCGEMDAPLMRWAVTLESRRPATNRPAEMDGSLDDNPAARCLPLLAVLARTTSEIVCLDYLDSMSLTVSCEA
jgi:hypothetical protein